MNTDRYTFVSSSHFLYVNNYYDFIKTHKPENSSAKKFHKSKINYIFTVIIIKIHLINKMKIEL